MNRDLTGLNNEQGNSNDDRSKVFEKVRLAEARESEVREQSGGAALRETSAGLGADTSSCSNLPPSSLSVK